MPWLRKQAPKTQSRAKKTPYVESVTHSPLYGAISHLKRTAWERSRAFPRVLRPLGQVFYAKSIRLAKARVGAEVLNMSKQNRQYRAAMWKNKYTFVNEHHRMCFSNDPLLVKEGWIRLESIKILDGTYAREAIIEAGKENAVHKKSA